jgi:peptidyl-prolyl cis-trans isomerase SurA
MAADASKPQYLLGEVFIDAQRAGSAEQAMAGANQLLDQMQKGAPFAAVARQFSSAPTAVNGGDMGWVTAGQVPPALVPALEEMRPGQLSAPIATQDGVYILQLRDKRSGAGSTMVELKQAAIRLGADATPDQVAAAKASLESLKTKVADCKALDTEAAKVSGVVAGDLGEADVNDLSPEFRTVINDLQVGQVGGPVRTPAGMHLVALCGKRASNPNAPSRDDIENRLYGESLALIARRELRDLRNSANIESR